MAADATVRELGVEEAGLAFAAMAELRPGLDSPEALATALERQRAEGYRLVAAFEEGVEDAVAVAGFRVGHSLAWGHYLYVDDLSTREVSRRRGHADRLMAWLLEEARRLGCGQLHLDSAVTRHDAHRFYLNRGMRVTSYHFARAAGDGASPK